MNDCSIVPLARSNLGDALAFIRSWSGDDVYDRFGSLGEVSPRWLAGELCENHDRRAFVARRDADVVGLLDFIEAEGAMHFGIVVAARMRRSRIGSALVRAFLAVVPPTRRVDAECRPDNHAALALLRSCGFTLLSYGRHDVQWRRA